MVAEDDETSKDKEIGKLMASISLSFKKIYKPTNNNLRTSSNTSRANQDNSPRISRSAGYENQRIGNVDGAKETVDVVNFGPIFDAEPLQKVSHDDHYNVFAIESEHPDQSKFVHVTYPIEQDAHNVIIDSLDMSYDREVIDQNYDDNDLANERELLASLIEILKCEIDERKNRNKFLKTSNKVLAEKLKGEIEDFKNKNKSLESSNNRFKETNNKLSEINNLLYTDFKKSEAELARRNNMEYASKMEIECAQVRGDFSSYKMESQKSFKKYTQTINDLNQTISKMKVKLSAHQETISILSQQKEAQIKLYKTCEDKELDKVITLENKVKVTYLQCDYLKLLEKCKYLETELSKSKMMLKSFEALQKQAINLEIDLQQCQEKIKNDKSFKENLSKEFRKEREQYFEIQDLKAQLQDKGIVIITAQTLPPNKKSILKNTNVLASGMYKVHTKYNQSRTSQVPQDSRKTNKRVSFSTGVISITSVSRPQLKSNPTGDRVMRNNSQGKKQEVEDQRRNVKLSACNDSLNAKTLNVNFVSAMYDKYGLNDKHDMYVLNFVAKPLKKTVVSESNQKPRNITRKLYERVRKTCSWWYPKVTPSGYKWKPKSRKENVNPNVSMPLEKKI
nr:hypothetical protein [Tanacetum cinerariifolium]